MVNWETKKFYQKSTCVKKGKNWVKQCCVRETIAAFSVRAVAAYAKTIAQKASRRGG